jgi:hypothetical protein
LSLNPICKTYGVPLPRGKLWLPKSPRKESGLTLVLQPMPNMSMKTVWNWEASMVYTRKFTLEFTSTRYCITSARIDSYVAQALR